MKLNKFRSTGFIVTVLLMVSMMFTASAHPGRTDANGGHWDRKTGTYHYHNGGSSGSSSGSSSSASTTKGPVYASRVEGVDVPKTVNVGECTQFTAKAYPSDCVDNDITWRSDNEDIATITSDGMLTAVSAGKAVIVAETSKGKTAKFTVTVKEIAVKSISIKNKPSEMLLGDKLVLEVDVTPDNATDNSIAWSSSDVSVIKVGTDGTLEAVGIGKTTVTASHSDIKDSFDITVKGVPVESVSIAWIVNDKEVSDKQIRIGGTANLSAVVQPDNATDKTVKWSVNDENIATVDANGVVTGIAEGKVIVTAETPNGIKAEYELDVRKDSSVSPLAVVGTVAAVGAAAGGGYCIINRKKKTDKE